jgi:hypothetical protein
VNTCGSCRRRWSTWTDFFVDPAVRLLGLQAVEGLPDANLLVFEHGCGSSVSVLTKRLHFLLPPDDVRREWPSLRGTEACPRHCLSLADVAACDRHCSNARDRDLIAIVQQLRDGLTIGSGDTGAGDHASVGLAGRVSRGCRCTS